jgi:xylulose-5-phosphate/fructose-6-phosphate phosphoketolase
MGDFLSQEELSGLDAYWRASNYLAVGQIYLKDNPLLKVPLSLAHIKPRLLGHWGTTPGLNLIYTHLNRLINQYDLNMLFVAGPGHGGPAVVAQTYLEGTFTECWPAVEQNTNGLLRLFRQFSWPYGISSHVSALVPGSIHEGGELGYCLAHAYGAAFDNPDLIVACVIGDGEAETGPLAASWHANKFINMPKSWRLAWMARKTMLPARDCGRMKPTSRLKKLRRQLTRHNGLPMRPMRGLFGCLRKRPANKHLCLV